MAKFFHKCLIFMFHQIFTPTISNNVLTNLAYSESKHIIHELTQKLKEVTKSEAHLKTEVSQLIKLNQEADQRYYHLDQSKQELMKMQSKPIYTLAHLYRRRI
jgi:peptidoglycan hydrolase CwlO-like protein